MIRLLIGILTAMWMFSACEKVDVMNENDSDKSEGVKEIVMHVGISQREVREARVLPGQVR